MLCFSGEDENNVLLLVAENPMLMAQTYADSLMCAFYGNMPEADNAIWVVPKHTAHGEVSMLSYDDGDSEEMFFSAWV